MNPLSDLNLFGAAAVALMMLAYMGEERGKIFTLIFALTCLATSAYGWLSGTWPFGVIEAIWGLFAFRKWYGRIHKSSTA